RDLRDAHCRGGTWTRVEDREFTEHVRWAHHGQQILAAVRGVTRQLHLAGGDDVQGVALLALLEDRGSAGEVDGLQLLNQSLHGLGVYPLKDSSAGQNLGVLCHLFLTLPLDDVSPHSHYSSSHAETLSASLAETWQPSRRRSFACGNPAGA